VSALRVADGRADNRAMPENAWQRRIARAETLSAQYPCASEVLRFFVPIVRFQEDLHHRLESAAIAQEDLAFKRPLWPGLARYFPTLLTVAEEYGPDPLAETARHMHQQTRDFHSTLLNSFWTGNEIDTPRTAADDFLARAFLQPYAEFVRSQAKASNHLHTPCLCPFCDGKPGLGVLRPLGDGGQRFLLCSRCLAEWEFRRIVCPGCGEENHAKLPIYRAEEFNHLRVECCDACKTYVKTVDLTKNGLAEPIVDEIASIPLDLWAQKQGYSKLQLNLMQF
jgi:FdhE protein